VLARRSSRPRKGHGKDREKSVLSSESFIKLAMIQLMLQRLEPSGVDPEFRYPRPVAA